MKIYECQCQKACFQTCVPSEDSDQLRICTVWSESFTWCILDSHGCKISSCREWSLWSNCADADLILHWAHMSESAYFSCCSSNVVIECCWIPTACFHWESWRNKKFCEKKPQQQHIFKYLQVWLSWFASCHKKRGLWNWYGQWQSRSVGL